jgi:hypothetical protein
MSNRKPSEKPSEPMPQEFIDRRQKCTAENPAPEHPRYPGRWETSWQHPDATSREYGSGDYDDIKAECPHCKRFWIYEGPDA